MMEISVTSDRHADCLLCARPGALGPCDSASPGTLGSSCWWALLTPQPARHRGGCSGRWAVSGGGRRMPGGGGSSWLRVVRNLSHSLEAGSPKSGCWQGWVLGVLSWVADGHCLIIASGGGELRARKLSRGSCKGADPICKGSTLLTSNHLPQALLMPSRGGGRASAYACGGDTQHSVCGVWCMGGP